MENRNRTCQLCHNHCPESAPRCERGKAFFQNNGNDSHQHNSFHESRNRGWHRKRYESGGSHAHFRNHEPSDSLAGLLMQSGHYLYHYMREKPESKANLFSGLSDDERSELKRLLTKLITFWNESV